jgi:hypothetical protein
LKKQNYHHLFQRLPQHRLHQDLQRLLLLNMKVLDLKMLFQLKNHQLHPHLLVFHHLRHRQQQQGNLQKQKTTLSTQKLLGLLHQF